jgi:hypothetical protein
MISKKWQIGVVAGLIFCLTPIMIPSCTHDPAGIELLDTVCFDTQILQIIQTSCKSCHDGSTEGFSATDYASIMQSVTPGDPRGSKLYKAITDIWGEHLMPPDQPLSRQNRTLIEVWIAQGATNKHCNTESGGNGGGGGDTDCNDSIYFMQYILPLFTSKCASCHDGSNQGDDDVYALNSYASIRQHVKPFNPSSSAVYKAVNGSGEEFMPPSPNAPLTTAEKELMRKWIAEGARNNACTNASCDTTGTIGFANQLDPILQGNCVGCHNSSNASGGVNLSSYSQVKTYTALVNGYPRLIGAIKKLPGFKPMPPSFSLDQCSVRKMELWIEQGMAQK